jgi:hypothetical protein
LQVERRGKKPWQQSCLSEHVDVVAAEILKVIEYVVKGVHNLQSADCVYALHDELRLRQGDGRGVADVKGLLPRDA